MLNAKNKIIYSVGKKKLLSLVKFCLPYVKNIILISKIYTKKKDKKMSGKIDAESMESDKHNGDATCLVYFNEFLYSGGADGKIKVKCLNDFFFLSYNEHVLIYF